MMKRVTTLSRPQASEMEDSRGILCRNRRLFGTLERSLQRHHAQRLKFRLRPTHGQARRHDTVDPIQMIPSAPRFGRAATRLPKALDVDNRHAGTDLELLSRLGRFFCCMK